MAIKAKAPKEDPETVARREAAERRAESSRLENTQDILGAETRAVIRQFGQLARSTGQPSLVNSVLPGQMAGTQFASKFARNTLALR